MNSLTGCLQRSRISAAFLLAVVAAIGVGLSAQQQEQEQQQPVPSSNTNMVSGTSFPDGDPYLQRQNEPNAAVSTRNPLHLLAGANDYRTVDLPGPFDQARGFKMAADAWVSLFKSLDGGKTWTSTLLPGFPQDASSDGLQSPIRGREGATDPVMRAGTSGLFYFAGVAFDRGGNQPSAIFVTRYMDLNNREAGDPFGYVDTRLVANSTGTPFLDKVALATDIPRSAATCTIASRQSPDKPGDPPIQHMRTIPAGNVYVAYAAFSGSGETEQSEIRFARSSNCGETWTVNPLALSTGSRLVQNPQIAVSPADGSVYVSWRRFRYLSQDDAVMVVKSINGGQTFSKPVRVSGVNSFDLVTSGTQFRSNGFQTMALDATGRVYLAWPDRGYAEVRSDPNIGDSRIVVSTSANGSTWTVPRAIQTTGVGHQLMPAMAFHGGKLRILYYDLREDVSQIFGPRIDEQAVFDGPAPRIRHTMDVFVAQAAPAVVPSFTTARVSEYATGFVDGSIIEQQLQFNPPNLPMFKQGTAPFMGDYIDLAPSPPFVLDDNNAWVFNTGANGSTVSHAVWTDNRDVRAPRDGNWANYTPVKSPALGVKSRFDENEFVPACNPGQVGMRNQNIYTARVTDGLFVSVPGNNKPSNGFQRAFVLVTENASALARTYRLRIENQPAGGQASFLQFGDPLTTLDVYTPALSSVARTVFVSAPENQNARISVSVVEVDGVNGPVVVNGLTGTVVLNPDPQNPVLQNPVLQNPVLQNPVLQNIAQGETYNPSISIALVGTPNLQNPVLQNPNLQNPNLQNPSIQNPHLQNPVLQNPNLQNPVLQNDLVANPSIVNADLQNPVLQNPVLQNPNLQNPNLQNPNLQNAGFSDTNWVLTNEGNTTASYTINLLLNNAPPDNFTTQLLIHKTVVTPTAKECDLAEVAHTVLIANIPTPDFFQNAANPNLQNPNLQNPNLQNPAVALAPGETATITLRVMDPNIFDAVTYDASAAVTPAAAAQSVNTDDVRAGRTAPRVAMPLTITTSEIPPTTPGAPINRTIGFAESRGLVTCSVVDGALPPGVVLTPAGTLTGTPTTPGNYVFTIECVETDNSTIPPTIRRDRQTLSIQVNPASPIGYDAIWNGLDTNWYNPANWSPRGVPSANARVYVSAATTRIPTLTADATVRDLFLEPGARLDTKEFTLTVTNNADAGRTIIGSGATVLTGNGGTASGVFADLEIRGRITLTAPVTTTGTLTLAQGARLELNGQPLIVGGQLITDVSTGALPVVVGSASNLFLVAGVNVNGLVLNNAPLTINAGALARFDNVSFSGFAPEAVQLTVNNPGLALHFPMNGLSFSSQPTSGQYIQANDTLAAGPQLIIDVLGAVPADGAAFTLTTGGAAVNWLGNPGEANLAVTQTVTPIPAPAGARLSYLITVTNGGPLAAQDVLLNPGVPFGSTGVMASATQGSCIIGSGGPQCSFGNLAAGASAQATVSFLTNVTGTLVTTAVVTSSTPDSVIGNNSHTISAVIVPAGQGVDLHLTKTDSADPVALNTPFTYTLTVSNVGTTEATNVVVTDNVPSDISITFATSPAGMCSPSGSQVLCSFASILPGQTVTMTFDATGATVGLWTNQASVKSAQIELTPADNVVSETTMVVAVANCAVLSFSGPAIVAANGPTGDVLTGDLNGDGFKDVVAPVPSANAVAVLLGNGSGSFGAPTLYPTGTGTHEGVILDLNGDGRLDIALEGSSDAFVLFGNGSGGFGTATPISYSPATVGDVRAGDFNGDGRPDLAITTISPNQLRILLNNGSGAFIDTATPLALPGTADRIAVQDLNGDNRPDLALSYTTINGSTPAGQVSILIGAAGGEFLMPANLAVPFLAGSETRVFGLGDVNGDNRTDLAVIEALGANRSVYLLSGNGAGGFTSQLLTAALSAASRIEAGDVNGDGRKDLAISSGSLLHVFLGNGAGGFGQPSAFSVPFGRNFQLADLNGDNRLDVASALNQGNGVAILLNGCGQPAGNLVLSAFDSPDPVAEGATLTYSSTVTNAANVQAATVTLTQTLSGLGAAGTVTSSQGTCTITNGLVTCNLGPLAPNASAGVQVTFTPSTGGTLSSVVGVGSERPDSSPADNVVTVTTTVTAAGGQIAVINTNDAGPGSLRQAILDSNADSGDRDTVVFDIPGTGARTITLLSALPGLSQPVVIDGTTQTGYNGAPIIELNGNGVTGAGLLITGGNSIVRGLAINRFNGAGIVLQSAGNVIEGNYIGTDASGALARPNAGHGVQVLSPNNRIGGLPAAARNVISGNGLSGVQLETASAAGNLVQGNYLGLNAAGTQAVPNTHPGGGGVSLVNGASGNTIGGSVPGAGNVASGNTSRGIVILGNVQGADNVIQGNLVGTDPTGTLDLGNGEAGIEVGNALRTIVGGPGIARNIVSGNNLAGIWITVGSVGTVVTNNYVGLNRAGTGSLPNSVGIIIGDSGGNTIGGTGAGAGNVVSGNTQHGITIVRGLGGNVIQGNLVGTDATGTLDRGNTLDGILIQDSTGTLVGGTTPSARNVISGNDSGGVRVTTGQIGTSTGNNIRGNYIGVNASGVAAIGNAGVGVRLESGATGNTIGGPDPGAGNLIAGNGSSGVLLSGAGNNMVQGNRIGTDDLATTSIPNGGDGVTIQNAAANTIGGIELAHRNVISGNVQSGVSISGAAAVGTLVANNFIGTNGSGMSAVPNNAHGVVINNSSGNTVGTPDAGNVISGNVQNGIAIVGGPSSANQIFANRIGVNILSSAAIGNSQDGIRIEGAPSTVIGGSGLARNVIGGNGQNGIGVYAASTGQAALGTQIIGNTIGFRSAPNTLGNGLSGIHLGLSTNATIGGDSQDGTNLISWNGRNGVTVLSGAGNRINVNNSIASNSVLGIDLGNNGVTANDGGDGDAGPNNGQNFPVLAGVAGGVTVTLNSLASALFTIQFYANVECDLSGNGEGETFLDSVNVNTDLSGNATIPLFAAAAGRKVTATATSGSGDTSEFSTCVTVPEEAPPAADLSLTMTDSADPVTLGVPFNYLITAQNAGPNPATGVKITTTLPAGLTATSASASQGICSIAPGTVTCNLGVLGVNGKATATMTITSSLTGLKTSSATITSDTADPMAGNNTATQQTLIQLASCSGVTFTGPTPYAGSAGPMAVVRLVDMNHDGRLDAVATHEGGSNGVDVFLNNGNGGFGAPRFTSTVTGPWLHVVADFNGDTHPDVITATDRTAPGNPITLRLLTNDGTGTLTLAPSFSIPFGGHLTAVDIDRDGDQDLAIATTTGGVALLRNGGQANFGAPETILANAPGFATFGDLNGDNRTDVVATLGAPGVAVLLANATGGFLPPVTYPVPGGAHGAADPVDLNGDSRLDLLIVAGDDNGPTQGASVLFGNGAGGFGAAVPAIGDFLYWPTLTDLNGDGRPDLVAISSVGSIAVWQGNGGANFSAPVHYPNAVYYGPVVGDLNGDGRPDIATGDINGTLNVFLNNCGAAPANLGVAVAESGDPVNEGAELVYTVTVTNHNAAPATGVRLTSVLAQFDGDDPQVPNVIVVGITSSAGGALSTTGGTYLWTVPALAANGTATFTFRFRPLIGGTLYFTSGVSSDGTETDPADNADEESTTVNGTGSTLVVTTAADSGPGSLREAINASNADSGDRDTIIFNIPGSAVPTITLQSGLPMITQPVIIDGTTQPTAARVELNGNGLKATGLVISGGNSIVRGMVINRFGLDGISLEGNGGNVVEGNLLGTDATGTLARANAGGGIRVFSANNRVGGLTAAARNVISANGTGVTLQGATATDNVVQGNYIGTTAAGTSALGNGAGINVNLASGNTIGGTAAGAGNVISGNSGNGVWINAANANAVQGNRIGTNAGGTAALPNGFGVFVSGAFNQIGGTAAGAGNTISGNTNIGISVAAAASDTLIQGNRIGVNAAGTGPLQNGGHGVFLDGFGTAVGGSTAGAGNVIANNGLTGVRVNSGAGHSILGNSIFSNASLGIDLGPAGVTPNDLGDADAGANDLQNFPVLSAVAGGVQGTLNSVDSTPFTLQFFSNAACDASGNGEGQTVLGTPVQVTTDINGNATIPFFAAPAGAVVTVTATSPSGETSEFSRCVTVPGGQGGANLLQGTGRRR